MKRFFFCIALVSALLAYAPVFAAINLYLKVDGIEGESKDEAHQGWIDLSSFQFGATGPHIGHAGGATRGPTSPSLRSRSSWTKARLACCSKPPLQRRSKMPRLM